MKNQELNDWHRLAAQWIEGVQSRQPLYSDLSEEQVQNAYRSAYDLYDKKNYEQASYFFQVLVWVRPLDKKYWKGLGACQQALKKYLDALQSYQCFQKLCQEQLDPYISIHQADCFFALGEIETGLQMLDVARLIAESTSNTQVITHVCLMHEVWSKQMQLT